MPREESIVVARLLSASACSSRLLRSASLVGVFGACLLAAPAPAVAPDDEPKQAEPAPSEPAPSDEPAPSAEPAPADEPPAAEPASGDVKMDTEQIRSAARKAMTEAQWAQAANGWATLLQFLPGDEEAVRERARAQSMLEGGSVIGAVSSDREVRRQQAMVRFRSDMDRARQLAAQDNFAQAKRTAVTARMHVDLARGVLTSQDFDSMSTEAESLVTEIDDRQREHDSASRQQANAQQASNAASSQRSEAENRAKTVNNLLLNVRKLQMQQKYEEALQVLDGVFVIDPNNPAALTLRDALRTNLMYVKYSDTQRRRAYGIGVLEQEGLNATVPPEVNMTGPGPRSTNALITYPEEWARMSEMRAREPDYGASGYRDSSADYRVMSQVRTSRVDLPFDESEGVSLDGALKHVMELARLQYLIDWPSIKAANPEIEGDEGTRVRLRLGEMPLDAALRRILSAVTTGDSGEALAEPLQYDVQDGIVVVTTKQALRAKKVMVVYDVRDLLFRAPDFTNAPEFNLNQAVPVGTAGGQAGGGGGGGGGGSGPPHAAPPPQPSAAPPASAPGTPTERGLFPGMLSGRSSPRGNAAKYMAAGGIR
jgi:hypothetical protein